MLLSDDDIKGKYVLVVDDQPHARQFLRTPLESLGMEVHDVSSGKEALKEVKKRVPDIIMLDAMMPGMDGYEVCRRLRASFSTREVPIIFVTADARKETVHRWIQCGGNEFVAKPAGRDELIQRVRTQLTLQHLRERVRVLETKSNRRT
jgi:CheY-like chemotaxis protein